MSKAEEKRQREQLIRQVRRLTRARVNDAVKLAYLSGEALEAIDGLDLTAMTEFKRAGNGAVEIKFTDRLKALEKLMELIRENRETEAEELLRTLGGTAEEPEWSCRRSPFTVPIRLSATASATGPGWFI